MWVYVVGAGGPYSAIAFVGTNDYASTVAFIGTNNAAWSLFSGAGAEATGGTVSTNTWYHLCAVKDDAAANDLILYVDGGATTVNATGTGGTSGRYEFGAVGTSNFDPFNGRITAIKWWSASLSAEEREAERYNFLPRRYANLEGFYPCIQAVAADNVEDWSGNGRGFTAGGTLTVEDGPPISWGAGSVWHPFVAAAPSGGNIPEMMHQYRRRRAA